MRLQLRAAAKRREHRLGDAAGVVFGRAAPLRADHAPGARVGARDGQPGALDRLDLRVEAEWAAGGGQRQLLPSGLLLWLSGRADHGHGAPQGHRDDDQDVGPDAQAAVCGRAASTAFSSASG